MPLNSAFWSYEYLRTEGAFGNKAIIVLLRPWGQQAKLLDANGGKDGPYLTENLERPNANLEWKLIDVNLSMGNNTIRVFTTITPVVRNVILDANGGREHPYFNEDVGSRSTNANFHFDLVGIQQNQFIIRPRVNELVILDSASLQFRPINDDDLQHQSEFAKFTKDLLQQPQEFTLATDVLERLQCTGGVDSLRFERKK